MRIVKKAAVLFLVSVCLTVVIALATLMTTGWRLDPLVKVAGALVNRGDLPAEVRLERLWVKLSVGKGLQVIARDLSLSDAQGNPLLSLDRVRMELPADRLRARHWLPAGVVADAVVVHLQQGEEGQLQWVPLPPKDAADTVAETTMPNPDEIWSQLSRLTGLSGESTRVVLQSLEVRFPASAEFQVAGLRGLQIVLTPEHERWTVATDVDVFIDDGGGSVSHRVAWEYPAHAIATELQLKAMELGWSRGLARMAGFDAGVEGSISLSLAASFDVKTMQPLSIELQTDSGPWTLAAPEWLRQPLPISPFGLDIRYDFATQLGTLEPMEFAAGPLKISAGMDLVSADEPGGGEVQIRLAVAPMSPVDWRPWLQDAWLQQMDQWLAEAGDVRLDAFELAGTVALRAQDNEILLPDSARWDFALRLRAGGEQLVVLSECFWRAEPFLFRVNGELQPLVPAGLHLPGQAGVLSGAVRLPVSASGFAVFSALDQLETAQVTWSFGAGALMPVAGLESILVTPIQVQGISGQISLADDLKFVSLDYVDLTVEELRAHITGSIELDQSVLQAQPNSMAIHAVLTLENALAGVWLSKLNPEILAQLPVSEAEVADFGFRGARSSMQMRVGLGADWQIENLGGNLFSDVSVQLASVLLPLQLRLEAEGTQDDIRIEAGVGLQDWDLATILAELPLGGLQSYVDEFNPQAQVERLSGNAIVRLRLHEEPLLQLESISCDLALGALAARLSVMPDVEALLAVQQVAVEGMIWPTDLNVSVTGMTSSVADWLHVDLPAIQIHANQQQAQLSCPLWSAGPFSGTGLEAALAGILTEDRTATAKIALALDLAEAQRMAQTAPIESWRDAISSFTGSVSGTVGVDFELLNLTITPELLNGTLTPDAMAAAVEANLKVRGHGVGGELEEQGLAFSLALFEGAWHLGSGVASGTLKSHIQLEIHDLIEGFVGFEFGLGQLSLTDAEWQLSLNATDLQSVVPGLSSMKRRGEIAVYAVEGRGSWLEPQAWNLVIEGEYKLPFYTEAAMVIGDSVIVSIPQWRFGRSMMSGIAELNGDASILNWSSTGSALHVYELVRTFEPIVMEYLDFLQTIPAIGETAPVAIPAVADDALVAAPDAMRIQATVNFDQVFVTEDRYFEHMRLAMQYDGAGLPDVHLVADEKGMSRFDFSMTREPAPAALHRLHLQIPDVAGLANLLVAPLDQLQLTSSMLGENLAVARRVPDSFRGGTLLLQANYFPEDPDTLIEGALSVDDLLMVQAPCLLRLVAGVSGKSFIEGVAFRRFALESFRVGPRLAQLTGLDLDGPVSMKIHEGEYDFTNQFISVRGEHALTHFLLKGPILAPEVYLDNRLTRMLGSDDSDLLDW